MHHVPLLTNGVVIHTTSTMAHSSKDKELKSWLPDQFNELKNESSKITCRLDKISQQLEENNGKIFSLEEENRELFDANQKMQEKICELRSLCQIWTLIADVKI